MLNLSLRKWTKVQVDAFRKAQSGKALSYDFPMITFDFKPVKGWNFDVQKAEVGEGQATFDFLKPQLLQWKQFPLGWTTIPYAESAFVGQTVAVEIQTLGIFTHHSCKVVAMIDEPNSFGIIYGTLPEHAERGEELFMITQNADGKVYYEIRAFSRPNFWYVWIGYPFLRLLQARFRRDSIRAVLATLTP